jgi:hypothetical protein
MPVGKLRAALLASAALTALCLPPARPALADCTFSDLEQALICSGDLSGGVYERYQSVVIVRGLTQDSGTINLFGRDSIRLTTEAGPYGITVYGAYADGIAIDTTESARLENNLQITMPSSWYGTGIDLAVFSGTGTAEVINRGDVTMLDGFSVRGIVAAFGDGGGTARVENHGAITLEGDFSRGIQALSSEGDATITNDGRVTITGDRTIGLRARTYGGATLASIVNSGDLTSSGANATGIFAYGANDARVDNDGAITITGAAGRAIVARGYNNATVQNDGLLKLDGASSYGIDARVFGPVLVTNTGDITATGSGSFGVTAFSTRQGKAAIVNSGDITTSGGASRGLWASAANGDAYVKNDAIISNSGPGESLGIGAFASIGLVTVKNGGAVTTAGGHAIMATNFNGDIDITNDASLTAGRDGIYASVFTDGGAAIDNSGEISGGTGGIRVQTVGGDISVANTGHVSTSGDSAIDAVARSGSATIENHGAVDSAGRGIFAYGSNGAVVRNHAGVTVTGDSAPAIGANTNSSDTIARVENDGAVTTSGDRSDALAVGGGSTGTAEVVNQGDLATSGVGSRGIHAVADDGVSVENHAVVTTHGDNAHAIDARVTGSGDVDVTNTNDLTATGLLAGGIIAEVGTVVQRGSATIHNSGIMATRIAAIPEGTVCSPYATKPFAMPRSRPPTISESTTLRRLGRRRASGCRIRSQAINSVPAIANRIAAIRNGGSVSIATAMPKYVEPQTT